MGRGGSAPPRLSRPSSRATALDPDKGMPRARGRGGGGARGGGVRVSWPPRRGGGRRPRRRLPVGPGGRGAGREDLLPAPPPRSRQPCCCTSRADTPPPPPVPPLCRRCGSGANLAHPPFSPRRPPLPASGRKGKGEEKATRARPAAAAARASDTPPPRAWRWGAPAAASTGSAHDAPGRGRRRLWRCPTRATRALAQTVATKKKTAAGGVDSPSGCPSLSPPISPLRAACGRRRRRCPPIEGVPLPSTVFEKEVERRGGTRRGRG